MKKPLLPILSKQKIVNSLEKKELEDLPTIEAIEKFLVNKRGYIFKMPPANAPVILLLSGGMDSITLWGMLMKHYKLQVYPLVISKKNWLPFTNRARTFKFYCQFYEKKFPKQYHRPLIIQNNSARDTLNKKLLSLKIPHSKFFVKYIGFLNIIDNIPLNKSGLMSNYAFMAHDYAELLLAKYGIEVETFFCAVVSGDGLVIPAQTLTSLRAAMLDLCVSTHDYSLQFTAPIIEKELGFFYDKDVFVKWAQKNKIPLTKTHSCDESNLYHCGHCASCRFRKYSFQLVKIPDTTFYLSDLNPRGITHYLKVQLDKFKQIILN